jgi:hypothetical protein
MFKIVSYIVLLLIVLILLNLCNEDSPIENKKLEKEESNITSIPKNKEHQIKNKPIMVKKIEPKEDKHKEKVIKYCLKDKKSVFSWEEYLFDTQGRIKTVTIDRNRDKKAESKSFFTYDENGNLIKVLTETYQEPEKIYSYDELLKSELYSLGETQSIPTQTSEMIKEYDAENRVISESFEKDGFSRRVEYEYNEKGDLCREIIFWDDALIFDFKVENSYDKKGRLIKKEYKLIKRGETNDGVDVLDTGGKHTSKEYLYNDKNQIVQMKDPSYARIFKYEYDTFGNRVKEKIYRTNTEGEIIKEYNEIDYKYDKNHNLIETIDSQGNILLKQSFIECYEPSNME